MSGLLMAKFSFCCDPFSETVNFSHGSLSWFCCKGTRAILEKSVSSPP